MRWKRASVVTGLAGFVMVSAAACAPQASLEAWVPPTREDGRPGNGPGGGDAGHASLLALNKILSSGKLSAFDRSIYLSIRAYQLNRVGREADSQKDIAEMGKVLPATWPVVLSGTLPELAGSGDRAAALRLLDNALQQKPGDPWLMVAEAQVYMQIADFQRALGLLDQALAATADTIDRPTALYYRGHANFNLGRYAAAAQDFGLALEGRSGPARLTAELWRYAAASRAGQDARPALVAASRGEPGDEWPAPIARFLLGETTAGQLEVVAESNEAAKRANGKCSAALFIGLEALRRGDRQRGREQLQLAQARCPTVSEINWAANSELKRL